MDKASFYLREDGPMQVGKIMRQGKIKLTVGKCTRGEVKILVQSDVHEDKELVLKKGDTLTLDLPDYFTDLID